MNVRFLLLYFLLIQFLLFFARVHYIIYLYQYITTNSSQTKLIGHSYKSKEP
jgi:hypothetical protein